MREVLSPPCGSAISNMSSKTLSHGPADVLDRGVWAPSGHDLTHHELPDPVNPEKFHKVIHYDYAAHILPMETCACCDSPVNDYKITLLTLTHYVYPCDDCEQFIWLEVIPDDYK